MKQFDYKLLKSYRAYAQMTQEEVSEATGISKAFISEIESGKKHHFSVIRFVKWAHAIGKEPNDFFVEAELKEPRKRLPVSPRAGGKRVNGGL